LETSRYQIFPSLTDEEYQALKSDIAEHGILVPIELDEAGNILDGHHRIKAWGELRATGIKIPDYPRLMRTSLSESEKLNHIRSLNLLRRHLNTEQQKPHWLEMRKSGLTYQAIADSSGVDEKTIRVSVSENSETQPPYVIGKDGKQYLYFTDYQMLGAFFGITAWVTETRELTREMPAKEGKLSFIETIGFHARAIALRDGKEISAAEAECLFEEKNWHNKPRFTLLSMAQTRACAKTLRNVLSWIVKLPDATSNEQIFEEETAEEVSDKLL